MKLFFSSVAIAAFILYFYFFANAVERGDANNGGRPASFAWSFSYELEIGSSITLVTGISALIATLNVALVAASWRPSDLSDDLESPIHSWTNAITGTMTYAASLSVIGALLAEHKKWHVGLVLLALAFLNCWLSCALVERESFSVVALRSIQFESKVDEVDRSLIAYTRDLPRYGRAMSRSKNLWQWAVVTQLPLITAVFAASIVIIIIWLQDGSLEDVVSASFIGSVASWVLGPTVFGALLGVYSVILGVVYANIPSGYRLARLIGSVGFAALWALGAWAGAYAILLPGSTEQFILRMTVYGLPLIAVGVLFTLGLFGHGSFAVIWQGRARRLRAELKAANRRLSDHLEQQQVVEELRRTVYQGGEVSEEGKKRRWFWG